MAGLIEELANRAHHHQRDIERGIDTFLAGAGLDEVRARHHADPRGARHVLQRLQFAGGEDGFQVHIVARAASGAEGLDLVVHRLPVVRQAMTAADDDVHLARSSGDRQFDLAQLGFQRRQAGRKAGGHHGHRNAAALQLRHRRRHHLVIDADGADLEFAQAQCTHQVRPQGPTRLRTQSVDAAGRVVAGQRGQVHALHGFHEPGSLEVLLHRSPRGQTARAALHGRLVDADRAHTRQVKLGSGVEPHRGHSMVGQPGNIAAARSWVLRDNSTCLATLLSFVVSAHSTPRCRS